MILAKIIQNTDGGWSIYLPYEGKAIGNYPTRERALKVCELNGMEVVSD